MLEQEQALMMPMPAPFDGYVTDQVKVSSTCLVTVQCNRYSVPCEWAGKQVNYRIYPAQICVVAGGSIVATHERLTERCKVRYDWQHYISLVERKPGALRNGAPFADMPTPLLQLRKGLMRDTGGDKIMAQVLAVIPRAGLAAVLVAVELVLESGVISAENVINVVARLKEGPAPACVETSLQLKEAPLADTRRYDTLRDTDDADINMTEVSHA